MKNLYLYLNIGSFVVPFLFSFHPKLQFYKKWKYLFPAIAIMMAFYISWDIIFTNAGFWGFNDAYITGYKIFNLPIEEWLFFICIPYACMFTHHSLSYLSPNLTFSNQTASIIYVTLVTTMIICLWYYYDRWYTLVNFVYTILLLGLVYNYMRDKLALFLPTFLIILLPFLLVNGVLTGSFIQEQVVWYDHAENMNTRIFTIPVEDSLYALGMLLTVYVLMEWLESGSKKV
ncbi:MAG: lycopene cyclase domain-containing protein [Planctomycetota bacterium]|jgi:lycopene cyclase domain-containing protein|uniref:lycopene cyclase domain-containing protein n=1 Tax=Patiriisocius sp. Uisw_047 TaxID=3230969 RepID=UPI0039E85907